MNLLQIAWFEYRYQTRSLQAGCLIALLLGLGILLTANGVEFQTTARGGNVWVNSPYIISHYLALLGALAALVGPACLIDAALRDAQHRFDGLLWCTTVSKTDLYLGRYFGSLAALLTWMLAAPLGLWLGSFWPGAVADTLGPVSAWIYLLAYLCYLLPSVLLLSALVYSLATASRSSLTGYLVSIGLLSLFVASSQSSWIGPWFDPFMIELLSEQTRDWTAFERNQQFPGFTPAMWQHRMLWLGLAGAALLIGYARFSLRRPSTSVAARPQRVDSQAMQELPPAVALRADLVPADAATSHLNQLWWRTGFEIRQVFLSGPFALLMAVALLLLISALGGRSAAYEVATYPVTCLMLQAIQESLTFALMVVLAFYSAEVIWRERNCRFNQIIDAMPVPNWVFVLSKIAAITLILQAIVLLGILLALATQWLAGFQDLQPGLYLQRGLLYYPLAYVFLAVLACFLQILANSRALGLILFFAFLGLLAVSRDLLGIEHILLSYGLPGVPAPLSDMNPDSSLAAAGWWARLYWASIAGLLLVLTYLLWSRGTAQPLAVRLRQLRQLRLPRFALASAALLLLGLGSAGYIYYNSNVLNEHFTDSEVEQLLLRFEREYRQYENLPMPRISAVDLQVDLYPDQGRVEVAATNLLRNQTAQAIDSIHLTFPLNAGFDRVQLEGATLQSRDAELGYHIYRLDQPMQPGQTRQLRFRARIQKQGFVSGSPDLRLVRNGSFISSSQFTPFVGVCDCMMVRDRDDRRRLGLPPLPRLPALDDRGMHDQNVIRADSDYIRFNAIVSTVADQIAIAPGELTRQWSKAGRRYFHYQMPTPMMNLYGFLSADYTVARQRWQQVEIEVFHHATHGFNVARMLDSAKDSLDYYSAAFGPYPFKQLRIVEFPAYRAFAQAFPTTIPYSEDLGFLADVSAPDSFDLPYYVTAHEVAHQWWAHQVMAARVQGSTLLIESLAQYSALMVMQKKLGPHRVRQFLNAELKRYLAGRADDEEGETPLYLVEEQAYIHYRKGGLVMYALQDYIGEAAVNRALQDFLQAHAFKSAPYATSNDLLHHIKQAAEPAQLPLIEDLFQRITLYDLKLEQAETLALPDGRYQLTLQVSATKFYADAQGQEVESPLQLPIDIGVFLRHPAQPQFSQQDVVFLHKRPLHSGSNRISLIVDRLPHYVGIDPYNKLIDRNAEDNLLELPAPSATAGASSPLAGLGAH